MSMSRKKSRPVKQDAGAAASRPEELQAIVAGNLRRIRTKRGYSLERLATLSGVSRAMLGQIETGRSAPTINLLWKIATSLEVPFSALLSSGDSGSAIVLKKENTKVLESSRGKFTSRALFPFDEKRRAEFYELRMAARHTEVAEAHAVGTLENIVVTKGKIEIEVDGEKSEPLSEGDSIFFKADLPHSYRNLGASEAVLYLVVTYLETIGG